MILLALALVANVATSDPALDFDLFGDTPAPVAAPDPLAVETQEAADMRRSLLELHQVTGLVALASMTTAVVLGTLNVRDLYGAGSRSGDFLWPHRIAAYGTAVAFAGTAAVSLLAPEPYELPLEGLDATRLHQIGVGVAAAGMLTQVALGFIAARQADAGNPRALRKIATAHEVTGFITLGALVGAAGVWLF